MEQSKGRLKISVGFETITTLDRDDMGAFMEMASADQMKINVKAFSCAIDGDLLAARYDFFIEHPPGSELLIILPFPIPGNTPWKKTAGTWEFFDDIKPIAQAIEAYCLNQEEIQTLQEYIQTVEAGGSMPREGIDYFTIFLSKILERSGYIV